MYGTIIGDVSGSYLEVLEIMEKRNKSKRSYEERIKIMNKGISLFNEHCSLTDDSILTIAIANAIINNISYEKSLRLYGEKEIKKGNDMYGRNPFGMGFTKWINNNQNNNSCGNGAAMRISPIGYLFDNEEEIKEQVRLATILSHNHVDSVKYAYAVAISIYYLRNGWTKEDLIKYLINDLNVNLDYDIEYLRNNYTFSSKIIDTVPVAIYCVLKSINFEDAIRTSLSIGGDSDTIACIVGAISESYYGVPLHLIKGVKKYIPKEYETIINQFYNKYELKLERSM